MTPDFKCPICYQIFRQLRTTEDPDDVARHYWWHKLEQLKKEMNDESEDD